MHVDSHEAGIANWTAEMPSHFKRLRGYDIDQWIPALAGVIVKSREATEKFLDDFRLTVSELVREQFYGTLASLCRKDGVSLTSQAMLGCANDNVESRGAHFFHRTVPEADIYFLYNHTDLPIEGITAFRTAHSEIECWNPLTSMRHKLAGSLTLHPHEAIFLITR